MFWVSSWFPTSPDKWAVFVVAGCILGLIAAHLAQKSLGERGWPAKATSALAFAVLIGGLLLILIRVTERSTVDAGITFFFVLGGMGYLFLVRTILDPRQTPKRYRGTGLVVLSLLAIWSWASAIGMYSLRGADRYTNKMCILVPNPIEYDTELTSIWEMRLPQVASTRLRPWDSYIWEFHAILVVDGRTDQYNWSKMWIRFEPIDPVRSPYLPKNCP
ncbi:hypothetical protein RC74_07110 [Falsihalocynthiibacter arcticus]|uniref:Uncharacterized protein n=1 Tax=Falsihalocynthiibacter arcticus TaxID=1579316 RepID=A0A126UYB7_9RHOB|nr:hypothetical protein RC74_07110 [Falsihalocynthiibacter arcticus]